MKIIHIMYSGLGGHGNVFFSLTDADTEHVFQPEALFFGVEEVLEQYTIKASGCNIPWYFVKKKQGPDITAYRKIMKIIKKAAPEIIFLHSSAYIFPAKLAALFSTKKTRIIIRETQANHLKSWMEWVGLSFSLLFADRVVFLSHEYRDAVKKKLSLFFSSKRTGVIPNGINLDVFKPVQKQPTEFVRIGMQSRLTGTKDHQTLIRAFLLLVEEFRGQKELQLWIAGEGESRAGLENLTRELALENKVTFTGMLEEAALPGFIHSLDIYVHATQGETMSTAIMQVMACGVPVIASDVLGVNNMIKQEVTGLLVPLNNARKMADSVCMLLENRELANKMKTNALLFAIENYSNKKMFESYRDLFLQLTGVK